VDKTYSLPSDFLSTEIYSPEPELPKNSKMPPKCFFQMGIRKKK